MSEKRLCPVCSEGHLITREEEHKTEYKGQFGVVCVKLAVCDVCGVETAGQDESRANKRANLRFRNTVDGLLLGEEIRTIRARYRLTQTQAAKLFGGGPVAFSKYENDDVSHSEAIDTLLRLVRLSEDAFKNLVAMKGIKFGFQRGREKS